MRIGILGEARDPEVALVGERLTALGATPVILDLRGFPKERRVEVRVEAGGPRIFREGEEFTDCAAWYVRRFGFMEPLVREGMTREDWNDMYGQFREWLAVDNEKSVYVASLLEFLEELAPVINPPAAFTGHMRKHHQVYLIRKAGLPVPDYVVSNDASSIRAFMERHRRVVYKAVAGPRHARVLTREHFDSRAHALGTEPIIVQALAEGRHLRVYVAGDRVVGAGEILFDREESIDYRKTQKGVTVVDLPPEVQRDCVAAARACGMPFTGLDLILDDEGGTHKFLECNPSPMFANFERATKIPVAQALADLLCDAAKRR